MLVIIFAFLAPNSANLKISYKWGLCLKFYLYFQEGVLRALPAGRSPGVNANQASCLTSSRLPPGPSRHRKILEQLKRYRCVETKQNKVVCYPVKKEGKIFL